MKLPEIPKNEIERLAALHKYGILDTEFDEKFDALTQLASQICNTKIALISLIDENRQWFKSVIGLKVRQTARGISFCSHAINQPFELLEVQDASQDERFFDNPLVIGDPYIRFYAGFPVLDKQGFALGTLCVLDTVPKKLTTAQKSALKLLAKQVYHFIELHSNTQSIENERQSFKRFAALSPSIIYRHSSHKHLIYHSPKVEDLLGYTQIDFKNNPNLWMKLIHKDDVNRVKEAFKNAKINQKTNQTYRIQTKDQSWLWVNDIGISLKTKNNYFFKEGVVTNITETIKNKDVFLKTNKS